MLRVSWEQLSVLIVQGPASYIPESTRDEARLCNAKQKTTGNEGAIVVLEGLEGRDNSEEEQLEREPFARTNTIQDHVGRNLKEHDTKRQHLLAHIELVLVDANIFHHVVSNSVRDVATVQLQAEEAQGQDWHDYEVKPNHGQCYSGRAC